MGRSPRYPNLRERLQTTVGRFYPSRSREQAMALRSARRSQGRAIGRVGHEELGGTSLDRCSPTISEGINAMAFESRNPTTGELLNTYPEHTAQEVEQRLQSAWDGWKQWSRTPLSERTAFLIRLADLLEK